MNIEQPKLYLIRSAKVITFSFVVFLCLAHYASAQDLSQKLSGRILLQVESSGEAWYINPGDLRRYYLGRPADAFSVMRSLGLGISENNYISFKGKAPINLSGKILLRVEASGEAYYVNPVDLNMHYLGRPEDAFAVMRKKGLGISNDNLFEIISFDALPMNNAGIKTTLNKISAYKAVVSMACSDEEGNLIRGSGVIVSPDGKILTNAHVISSREYPKSRFDCVGGIPTKEGSYDPDYFFNIEIFNTDITNDLAFGYIKNKFYYERYAYISGVVEKKNYPFLNINLEDKIGQTIYAIGYPDVADGSINITQGKITSKKMINNFSFILSDVGVSYGNSGGAIINEAGQLLGLATQVNKSELMSLTYILDTDSLKKENEYLYSIEKPNPYKLGASLNQAIYFIKDLFDINNIK